MQTSTLSTAPQLHVVTAITNPCRYESRYRLYESFASHMRDSGAALTTVEGVFNERAPMIADAVHVPISDELWHKENLLNIGFSRLPLNARYVAWIDADVEFMQPNWVSETLHALQHYDIIQPWSTAIDLGPRKLGFHALEMHTSFGHQWANGLPIKHSVGLNTPYAFAHPGFAWAARKSALDKVEGLMDWTLLGAADHIMALSLIGQGSEGLAGGLHPNYGKMAGHWSYLAEAQIKGNVGYIPGLLHHHWHGRKADRQYISRWDILKRNQYDPKVDILRDTRGVIRLAGNKPQLRDDLRRYFRQRMEDAEDI